MNYFGHCVAACWHRRDPGFVLGAMLPDFASMCGARLAAPGATDPAIAAGIDWHHSSDRAFHGLPDVTFLMAELSRRLAGRGVARGTSRGAAHVAVEMLLDGCLLDDQVAGEAYLAAIERAAPRDLGAGIDWHEPPSANHFETLRGHLAAHGLPVAYRDPRAVASRVIRVLSRRPLLAARPGEEPAVVAEIAGLAPLVAERAAPIMTALRALVIS